MLVRHCVLRVPSSCCRPQRRALLTTRTAMAEHTNGNGAKEAAAAAADQPTAAGPRNVLGGPLGCCCSSPYKTGYFRDGFCRTDESDFGRHVVCAQVTEDFLLYTRGLGNDLMTPAPWYNFPGLKPGDKWCLCAVRWREAMQVGKAPPVFLKCTHAKALEYVALEDLKRFALDLDECGAAGN